MRTHANEELERDLGLPDAGRATELGKRNRLSAGRAADTDAGRNPWPWPPHLGQLSAADSAGEEAVCAGASQRDNIEFGCLGVQGPRSLRAWRRHGIGNG